MNRDEVKERLRNKNATGSNSLKKGVKVLTIKDRVLLDYPLPLVASVWGRRDSNFDDLFQSCLDDLESDLELYDSVRITSTPCTLPEGTRAVTNCKAESLMSAQTNQFVKHTFDKPTRQVACRFLPALCTFKRNVLLEDLDNIRGSVLQYYKAYVIIKMLEIEISWLTAVRLESTTGSIDVEGLKAVKSELEKKFENMRADILFPSNG